MSRFLPCPSCNRHVNANDQVCPFCRASMPESAQAAHSPPLGRLSRIAVLAAGATLVGGAASAGCDGTPLPADGGIAGHSATGGAGGGGGRGSGGDGGGGGGRGGAGEDAGATGGSGGAPRDGGALPDAPIAIYAAAIAVPKN